MSGPHLSAQLAQAKALALLRIFMGLTFIRGAIIKPDDYGARIARLAEQYASTHPSEAFAQFLTGSVETHASTLASVEIFLAWAVGLALLLGVAVGVTGLVAAAMMLGFFVSTAHVGTAHWTANGLMCLTCVALSFGAAGTTWGLDRRLLARLPAWAIAPPILGVRVYERDD